MIKPTALSLVLIAAANLPLKGQDKAALEVMPVVGIYAPTNDLAILLPTQSETITYRHQPGLLLGARLVVWWTARVGWEGAFGYALSEGRREVDGTNTCGTVPASCAANVWIASSKLLGRWRPRGASSWFVFGGAGLSVLGHTGDFWDESDAVTDIAAVLDAGAVFSLGRLIDLRLDLEDHVYQFKPRIEGSSGQPLALGARWQHDLVLSASLAFRIAGGE